MRLSFITNSLILLSIIGLTACGGGGGGGGSKPPAASVAPSSKANSSITTSAAPSTSAPILSSSASSQAIAVELVINGGFESDLAEATSPTNWKLTTGGTASVIKVIESTAGANTHSGTKALRAEVTTVITPNEWSIEVINSDLGVDIEGGKVYTYKFWVKGTAGKKTTMTVGTPQSDGYQERARTPVTLTGDWQEVSMDVTAADADTKLRFATHLSIAGNEGAVIYYDDLSFKLKGAVEVTPVTVTNLYQLSPNNMPIGVAVPAGSATNSLLTSTSRQTVVNAHFNQLTAENIMKMSFMQPTQGNFSYTDADALVQYAKDHQMTVHGHALVWHSQTATWMDSFTGDKAAWTAMMENHVTNVATHFEEAGSADTVVSWDVVNEAFENAGGKYRGDPTAAADSRTSIWYTNIGPEFIEKAFIAANAADPDADLYYNDYNMEWNNAKLDAVIAMVNDFKNRGIPIDGIGFQMHIWSTNNINTLKQQFQKAVATGLKVKLSELDVRFNHGSTAITAGSNFIYEGHKQIVYDVVKAYLEVVPAAQRGGITSWGIGDNDSWIIPLYGRPDWPLLFFDTLQPKPALQGFADALEGK
jgi:endo-1,4-beta-xylanase